MLKAVIFDMDGVLVDSEPLHYEANRLLFEKKFDINLDYEYYKQYIGSTVTYMWEKMRNDFIASGHKEVEAYTAIELRNMADDIKEELVDTQGYMEIEGVSAFVKSISGRYRLAVASSSYLRNIERNVADMELLLEFSELVSGTEVKRPKPNPDIFLEAASRLGVNPSECIVIEDSENGVKAAKAAGMACLGFINPNSGSQDLSKADYLFESFDAIDGDFLQMVHAHCFDERYVVAESERLVLREMLVEDAGDETIKKIITTALNVGEKNECPKHNDGAGLLLNDEKELQNEKFQNLRGYISDYRKNSYKFLGFGLWLVELKCECDDDKPKVIGIAGIDRKVNGDFELGYYIMPEYRRLGYAYEACAEILDCMKDSGLDTINVTIEKNNEASIALAKKLMFDEFYSNDEYVFMDKSMA